MNCPRCQAELTPEEVASLNAQRSASMRPRPVKCACGKCPTCRRREAMRRYRAKRKTAS